MKIEKIENESVGYIIKLTNEQNKSFLMQYGGADFYWMMLQYEEGNEFTIKEEDSFLFSQMQQLFKIIRKYDNPDNKVLKNNVFVWNSEDDSNCENANQLMITQNENNFVIQFYQNPNRNLPSKNLCPICFCLNESKNPVIASAFSLMFLAYQNYQDGASHKKKIFKS